ncbi:hypothetical protein Pla52o_25830 [Novipirellula galeiformis]|uniref:Uncharacterized protein n=1 Tax=Novipirellula galeiformis TaxID=2528004 RepID=A0A5C6CJR1_9BACT|nr:hypothetical protein [Novipirellula galeiformis]TWU23049.1 hypothetical protein Pla52o_25830 [Novipirellula galeiformis]
MRYLNLQRGFTTFMLTLCTVALPAAEDVATLALFDAMDSKQVAVQFIPVDASHANVLIKNLTHHELKIQLPQSIAAVPHRAVLSQFGFNGGQAPLGVQGQGGQGQGGQNGGGNQSVGGGFQPGGPQGNNQFGNNRGGLNAPQGNVFGIGVMRIAAEKTRKVVATTVCLEHGKADPNPKIPYRMVRIESYTQDEELIELCNQLGRAQITQQAAQAVAWHLANGLSWNELTKLNRIESRYRGEIRLFKNSELQEAKAFVEALPKSGRSALRDMRVSIAR